MQVRSFGVSDVGRRRRQNEDRWFADDALALYIVADGMGGHKGGAIASQLAVDVIAATIRSLVSNGEGLAAAGLEAGDYKGWLAHAIDQASQMIYEKSVADSALQGMGTTAVVMLVRDDKAYVANVGDSRAYLVRNGRIKQVTEDHSLVGEQVKAGILSPEDAKGHRLRNIITRSVGFQSKVEVDVEVKPLRFNDRFMLCSDGLSNMVDDEMLLALIQAGSIEEGGKGLIDAANRGGGDDNITVLLVEVEDGETIDEPTMELE